MGINTRLEINVGVKEPVVANDLKLEGTGEGGGENEGGRSRWNHDAIDHIVVLINQLQCATIACGGKRQYVTILIYNRYAHGGFGIMVTWLRGIDIS